MLIITIYNDSTGGCCVGNYDYTVYVNKQPISSGRIQRHIREEGWQKLVALLLEVEKEKTP